MHVATATIHARQAGGVPWAMVGSPTRTHKKGYTKEKVRKFKRKGKYLLKELEKGEGGWAGERS